MIRNVWLLLALFLVRPAIAEDTGLRDAVGRIAREIKKFVDTEGESGIAVGNFTAPAKLLASGGPGLSQLLEVELVRLGVAVSGNAKLEVTGKFTPIEEKAHTDDTFTSAAVRVRVEIVEDSVEVKSRIAFNINVHGPDARHVTGDTFETQRPGPDDVRDHEQLRQEEIKRRSRLPSVAIVGNETRAAAGGLFGVEILVPRNGELTPRTPRNLDGRAYVDLAVTEEYQVRLYNRAGYEVAAFVSIDGLSSFAFTKEPGLSGAVIVPPGGWVTVPGWYLSRDVSRAFEITTYPDSAAASRGITEGVGTVSVRFAACFDPEKAAPRDAGPATKLGREIQQKYVVVPRRIGETQAVISVRYRR